MYWAKSLDNTCVCLSGVVKAENLATFMPLNNGLEQDGRGIACIEEICNTLTHTLNLTNISIIRDNNWDVLIAFRILHTIYNDEAAASNSERKLSQHNIRHLRDSIRTSENVIPQHPLAWTKMITCASYLNSFAPLKMLAAPSKTLCEASRSVAFFCDIRMALASRLLVFFGAAMRKVVMLWSIIMHRNICKYSNYNNTFWSS